LRGVLHQAFGEERRPRPTVLRPWPLASGILLLPCIGCPVPAAASNPYGQVSVLFAYLFRAASANCVTSRSGPPETVPHVATTHAKPGSVQNFKCVDITGIRKERASSFTVALPGFDSLKPFRAL
jgi:hypothetical protein